MAGLGGSIKGRGVPPSKGYWTGRGMEIDPLYVDAAIRRWQRYTGEAAVHAETGRRFEDVEHANKEAALVEA